MQGFRFQSVFFGVIVAMLSGCSETQNIPMQEVAPPKTFVSNSEESPVPPPPPVVSNKHVTLTDLNLNNQGNQIIVKPGNDIQVSLNYAYHCTSCNPALSNQILVGLANRSAQACIYDGGSQAQGSANFSIKVPAKPGKYEIRFRAVQAADCETALKAGWSAENSPASETTIGKIIASKKAETA